MNIWYKAWRESRVRFLVAAAVLASVCIWFMVWARSAYPLGRVPQWIPYTGAVWAELYGNSAPAIFSVIALILGLGGLRREGAYATAAFTLALPVSRFQLLTTRFLVGLMELVALALIPAVLLPALSPILAHHSYPVSAPLQFGLLYLSWGAIWLAVGVLWSTVLAGEYAAAIASILTPFVYLIVVANVSQGGRRFTWLNPFVFMSGIEHLQPNAGLFVDPLPWTTLLVLGGASVAMWSVAVVITDRQSF